MKKGFIVILLLMSCNNVNHNNTNVSREIYSVEETDSVKKLNIDEKTNMYSNSVHYFEDFDHKEYLTLENIEYDPLYGVIHFYDINTCKLIKTVKVNYEGTDVVTGFSGHGVINSNEIMVSSDEINCFYKLDADGKILHRYPFDDKYLGMEYLSLNNTPLICKKGKFYINLAIPLSRWNDSESGDNFSFSDCPLALSVDTATGIFEPVKLHYPELFPKNGNLSHNEEFSNLYDGEKFIYSFATSNNILVSNDLDNAKEYYAGSKFISKIENDGINKDLPIDQAEKYFLTEARYGNIIYDKYRKVYYRFCHFKDEKVVNNNNKLPKEYFLCQGDFSIIVLDSALHLAGETKFLRGKYVPKIVFVDKEGLWLCENNYERNDIQEDIMQFKCLKLKSMQ
ncbi:MAG: DUF4221 family protein [Bacteroidales bacterium]|nr:DUF4221 family protein [Bacteroidales bacterium]